jgi:hypothetical protein
MNHILIDERSRELDEVVLAHFAREPEKTIEIARENIARWLAQRGSVPALEEWEQILKEPIQTITELLASSSEEAKRLRQSSPFCGILTEEERRTIFKKYEEIRS